MFFNLQALVLVGGTCLLSALIHRKGLKTSLLPAASTNQLLVLTWSLGFAVLRLSQLSHPQELGVVVSLVLLSNLYAAVLNLGMRLYCASHVSHRDGECGTGQLTKA